MTGIISLAGALTENMGYTGRKCVKFMEIGKVYCFTADEENSGKIRKSD